MASSEGDLSGKIRALFYSAQAIVDRGRQGLDPDSRTMSPLFFRVSFGNTGQPVVFAGIRADATLALSDTIDPPQFQVLPREQIVSVVTLAELPDANIYSPSRLPVLLIGREKGPEGSLRSWVALPTKVELGAGMAAATPFRQSRLRLPLAEYSEALTLTTGLANIFDQPARVVWNYGADLYRPPVDPTLNEALRAASISFREAIRPNPYQRIP